jgi:hypothetical protein
MINSASAQERKVPIRPQQHLAPSRPQQNNYIEIGNIFQACFTMLGNSSEVIGDKVQNDVDSAERIRKLSEALP